MHQAPNTIDDLSIQPASEMGAFEALWALKKVASFKQLNTLLSSSKGKTLSSLVEPDTARAFYEQTIEQLKSKGIDHFGIQLAGTIDFPEKLKDADHPLALLYYIGNWDLVFSRGVSVVGTRNPTEAGIKRTKKLVKGLVAHKFTIFSGLAKGIDTAAHETAINNNGTTVAVMGTPLWLQYPKQNAELYKIIAKDHLIISQVPVVSYDQKDIPFNRFFFPERNKTMAALCEATIIVEAGETSGTLTQAKAALKQGRKVFILNSNFKNTELTWPEKLVKAGAIRAHTLDDILEGLSNATSKN